MPKGVFIRTKQHKENIGNAHRGKKSYAWKGGLPHCLDCGKRLSRYDCKRCQKCAYSGKLNGMFGKGHLIAGEKSYNWKGYDVGYTALHSWVRKNLGNPNKCAKCNKLENNNRKIHWANISKKYKRDLSDWIRLCAKCHKAYDEKARKTKGGVF